MATRSTITVLCDDGKYRTIYCHWDGAPAGVGQVLLDHYQTTDEARQALIALGNLSSLHESTECPDGHSFEHPAAGHCVAYGRDRGESRMEAVETDINPGLEEAFHYLWNGSEWLVCWRTLSFGAANRHKAGSYHRLAFVLAGNGSPIELPAPAETLPAEGDADGLDHLGLAELPLGALAI